MSVFTVHLPGSRLGTHAPPTDRAVPPAASRTLQRLNLCSRSRAIDALRRRPSTAGGGSGADGARAAQLFDLDREGAYSATTSAPAPAAKSADGGSGNGDGGLLDDGWGVATVVPATTPSPLEASRPVAKREKKKQKKLQAAVEAPRGHTGTPFVDMSSEAGLTGLTLLQQRLLEEGRVAHDATQKARVAAEAEARRARLAQTVRRKRDWVDPDELDVGEGEAEEMSLQEQQYFELNLDADGSTEVVEFDDGGRVVARRPPGTGRGAAATAAAGTSGRRKDDDDDDDPLAFLADLEDEDDDEDEDEGEDVSDGGRRAASGAAAGPSRRVASVAAAPPPATPKGRPAARGGRSSPYDNDGEEDDGRPMPGLDPLADEEIEWGLDELRPAGQRPSLMREMGVIKSSPKQKQQMQQQQAVAKGQKDTVTGAAAAGKDVAGRGKRGDAAGGTAAAAGGNGRTVVVDEDGEVVYGERDVGVAWGGSGGASGIDMEQQEALLERLFKPHKVKALMAHQRAAEEEMALLKKKTSGRQVLESKMHSRMRIIAGSAAGRQLASSQGAMTRPMMEKVRQAIFNMIESQAGTSGGLPNTARWLDCFAGTGSVGLEALSRGCRECHFIELDSWVCRKVLSKNIAACGFQRQAVVHTMKAEAFLRRSIDVPRFAGGSFDFMSVCPPYLVVSYPELMDLLERTPLITERSIVFVEYPKQLAHQVPATLQSLVTVRDRKYGRTFIRVYGPPGGSFGSDDDDEGAASAGHEDDDGDELLL